MTIHRLRWCARWAFTVLVLSNALNQPPPLAAQADSIRYEFVWRPPLTSPTLPPAQYYHWQLVQGDTTPKRATPLSPKAWGYNGGYLNVPSSSAGWGYIADTSVVVTLPRPVQQGDSLGPFWLAVQGYRAPALGVRDTSATVYGPYVVFPAIWTRAQAPPMPGPVRVVLSRPISGLVDTVWVGQFAAAGALDSVACLTPPLLVVGQHWSRGTVGAGRCINLSGARVGPALPIAFVIHAGDTLYRVNDLGLYASRADPRADVVMTREVPVGSLMVAPASAALSVVP